MKLYPCSPEYVIGTPAAIAARCWACCCCCCCCCKPGGHPNNGIWYPVGMLMFRSKKKLPIPVCDAGIFPASQLFGFEWRSDLLRLFIYTQLPASVRWWGRQGEVPPVVTDSYFQKTRSFHWQQIPSKGPSAVPFSVFVERPDTRCLSRHTICL